MLFCCKWLLLVIKIINFCFKIISMFVWFVYCWIRLWNFWKDLENVFFVWSFLIVCDVFWGCIEFVLIWIKGYVKFFFWKESLIIGENINVGNFNYNYFVV